MKSKETNQVIVYGHSFCGTVPTIRKILQAANVPHKYVDITLHPEASRHVADINDGNYSVPTLVFPDKSTLTEPSPAILLNKLEGIGYSIDARVIKSARRPNFFHSPVFLTTMMIVLYALLRFLEVI